MTYYARTEFPSGGGSSPYAISWSYLDRAHVYAEVDGEPYLGTISFPSPGMVALSPDAGDGLDVAIFRVTPTPALVSFQPGPPASRDINLEFTQCLYLVEEAKDNVLATLALVENGTTVSWDAIVGKPTFGQLARVGQSIINVDDWIAAAGQAPGVDDNTAAINAAMLAGSNQGQKIVMPSPRYKISDYIKFPNVDAVSVESWGESIIYQTGGNKPCFQMDCYTTVGNFSGDGFRCRWAEDASVEYSNTAGHLVGDTNKIAMAFKALGAVDGNGEYNARFTRWVVENGFRGISPNYVDTILSGRDFPLWGLKLEEWYGYQNLKGALMMLGNSGSGGGPNYTVKHVYDNAVFPVEASIQWNKTSSIDFGALEFNNRYNMACMAGISGRGITFSGPIRVEHPTLETRDTALFIFSSPDSGRALVNSVEVRSANVLVGAGAGDGNVYIIRCYAGAEAEVKNITVQDTQGNADKLIVYDPRIDNYVYDPVEEPGGPNPSRPYPPGRIYALGGLFIDQGPDGTERNGRSHDSIYSGPYIQFQAEELFDFGATTLVKLGHPNYTRLTTPLGLTTHRMSRRGWCPQLRFEVYNPADPAAPFPLTSGYLRVRLVKTYANGTVTPLEWVSYIFGPGAGGDSANFQQTRYISFGAYNDMVYGGGGDDVRTSYFEPDDQWSVDYAIDPGDTTPAISAYALRAQLVTASR